MQNRVWSFLTKAERQSFIKGIQPTGETLQKLLQAYKPQKAPPTIKSADDLKSLKPQERKFLLGRLNFYYQMKFNELNGDNRAKKIENISIAEANTGDSLATNVKDATKAGTNLPQESASDEANIVKMLKVKLPVRQQKYKKQKEKVKTLRLQKLGLA